MTVGCTLFGPPLPLPNSNPRSFLPFLLTKLPFISFRNSSWPLSKEKPLISRCYCDTKNSEEDPMEISACVRGSERNLVAKGRVILSSVPENVIISSADSSCHIEGVFLGAHSADSSSRHVLSLGILRGSRFLACFRFKLWWMAQKMGSRGSEIPCETQFLVVETKPDGEDNTENLYSVFLPVLEGPFRSSLQGNPNDCLEMCVESGDSDIRSSTFSRAVFVGTAVSDPFAAIARAVLAVRSHLRTFRLRAEKRLPAILDLFGWCTWDAFYRAVSQSGVEAGLHSLVDGGAPPKFLIIDDGWQSVVDDGEGSLPRLTGIKENAKFQSLESVVSAAKNEYGVKCVYVWHALMGYWGGVVLEAGFDSAIAYPRISPGVLENDPSFKTDALTLQGIGLMNPRSAPKFFGQLHAYLAAAGVDGVKVDAQSILETLGAGNGGRVNLTRSYHQALDSSIAQNFPDNGCIACMSHHTDALYCEKQTAVVRASDDFFPRDPMSHTIHIASVAYNSVFLGEFMVPDWDMFHSLHPAGDFHASARAISGGPVYVSDAPGKHNFELLRKLVLPDGSVLRARLPGRPTADCLFSDPTRDGISLLKIWNMNTFTGVLGVYNCQGAAWSSSEKKNTFHPTNSAALTSSFRSNDIHLISEAATEQSWNGNCSIYSHGKGALCLLLKGEALPISLNVLEHEVFTVSPIKVLAPGLLFAPLGLLDMFNAGGAIEGLKYEENVGRVCMEVKGCGRMGAYASVEPKRCLLGAEPANFIYDAYAGLLTLLLEDMPEGDKNVHTVVVEF